MSGVAMEIEIHDLDRVSARIADLADVPTPGMLDDIAAVSESQTRRRLSETKRAPDGSPWAKWSPAYARTREPQHSLLESSGNMIDSIFGERRVDTAVIGSPLVYAAVHQDGSRDGTTPERPFLGLSDDDAEEIEAIVIARWAEDIDRGAQA